MRRKDKERGPGRGGKGFARSYAEDGRGVVTGDFEEAVKVRKKVAWGEPYSL